MRENKVRISFDLTEAEHMLLKVGCTKAKVSIKNFMHEIVLKGINELEKKETEKRLKSSIQEAKEGKLNSRGSFSKYLDDEF